MKHLMILAVALTSSFSALALDCDLSVDMNKYKTKIFKGSDTTIRFVGNAHCARYKAKREALSKCERSDYSAKCELLEGSESSLGQFVGGGNSVNTCTEYYKGYKLIGKKSYDEVREEKCLKILNCQDNVKTSVDLNLITELMNINRC